MLVTMVILAASVAKTAKVETKVNTDRIVEMKDTTNSVEAEMVAGAGILIPFTRNMTDREVGRLLAATRPSTLQACPQTDALTEAGTTITSSSASIRIIPKTYPTPPRRDRIRHHLVKRVKHRPLRSQ